MSWVADNLGLIFELTLVHLRQSIIAIVIGLVLSIPLGWVAWRYRLVRGPIIVLTGRPDDAWLAKWSRAEAAVPHPVDPIKLGRTVLGLLRTPAL